MVKLITKYINKNPMTFLWSLLLAIGGAVFVIYHAFIGFMPDLDFTSIVTLMAFLAITALIVLIMTAFALVAPGIILDSQLTEGSPIRKALSNTKNEIVYKKVLIGMIFPVFFIYMTIFFFSIETWLGFSLLTLLVILLTIFSWITSKKQDKKFNTVLFETLQISLLTSSMSAIPLFLVYGLINTGEGSIDLDSLLRFLPAVLFIVFANTIVVGAPNKLWSYIGISVITLFIVSATFKIGHRIPYRVMEIFQFGNIQTQVMVLKTEGCSILKAYGIKSESINSKYCKVRNIKILSRLGKQYYLSHEDNQFPLNKSLVESWK